MSTTIRISDEARARLAALSSSTGRPMTELVEEALDALERRVFFDRLNMRYEALRNEPDAWSAIERERRAEEGSLGDSAT